MNVPQIQSLPEKMSWNHTLPGNAEWTRSVMKDQFVTHLLMHGHTYAQADDSKVSGML